MTAKTYSPRLLPLLLLLLLCPAAAAADTGAKGEALTPEAALQRLLEGNERYVAGRPRPKDYAADRRATSAVQHPYAIVLACADSRVPPEILFDESIGQLFVVRVAGNVADPVVLGSIEYAVEHLGATLLVVLGHEHCGAVRAAFAGGHLPPNIEDLVARIAPAVDKVRLRRLDEKRAVAESVRENVKYQVGMATFKSELLEGAVRGGRLLVAGGVYSLESGRVEMLTAGEAARPAKGEPHDPQAPEQPAPEREAAPHAGPAPQRPAAPEEFGEKLREAYATRAEVVLAQSMLMFDAGGRCAQTQCASIPAGASVRVEHPLVLNIMGRPHLKVRYRGKTCFILADKAGLKNL